MMLDTFEMPDRLAFQLVYVPLSTTELVLSVDARVRELRNVSRRVSKSYAKMHFDMYPVAQAGGLQ